MLVLVFAAPAFAARGKVQGFVEKGGANAITSLATSERAPFQRSFPGTSVTVYVAGTSTLATIASDAAGTSKPNPFTSDVRGFYSFWTEETVVDIAFGGSAGYTLSDVRVPLPSAAPNSAIQVMIQTKSLAIGTGALDDPGYLASSNGSVAVGYQALTAATTGDNNVAVGPYALNGITSAGNNTAVGANAISQTTGANNVAIGSLVGYNQTNGFGNVLIGTETGKEIRSGYDNTAVGTGALHDAGLLANSDNNVILGARASYELRKGTANVAVGCETLYGNILGDQIVDGVFAAGPPSWTIDNAVPPAYSNGWAAGVNKASKNAAGTGVLSAGAVAAGNWINYIDVATEATYTITYTVSDCTVPGQGVTVSFGGQSETRLVNGTFVFNAQVVDYPTFLRFTPTDTTARFSISAVSFVLNTGVTAMESQENTAVGVGAMYMASGNSAYNTAVGAGANRQGSGGQRRVSIGVEAAVKSSGNNNVAVGTNALYGNITGDDCVAVGPYAGFYETGNDKLYIDGKLRANLADGQEKSLIYGVFNAAVASQSLQINGSLVAGHSEVYRSTHIDFLRIGGGNAAGLGGHIVLYGQAHGSAPNQIDINATGGINANNNLAKIGGLATAGSYGTAPIVAVVALTGQSATIGLTNLLAAAPVGLYRASAWLVTTTADATAGTISLTLGYNTGAALSQTSGACDLKVLGDQTGRFNSITIYSAAAQNITYQTTVAGAINAARFALYITLERLA